MRGLIVLLGIAALASSCKLLEGGKQGSMSCFIASQYRCKEFPDPTPQQRESLPIECSSTSGELRQPAKCPSERFTAKCTLGSGQGMEIRRMYTGVDLQYEKDFCENTAHGAFSREF